LSVEDRSDRKVAIASLESSLKDVDKIKSELTTLQEDLNSQVQSRHSPQQCEDSQEKVPYTRGGARAASGERLASQPPHPPDRHSCNECGRLSSEGREGDAGFEGHWFCSDCWRAWKSQSYQEEDEDKCKPHVVPENHFWEQLKLPLQFEPCENSDCYTITCASSNLCSRDINLQLNRDASRLTLAGVHVPTAAELQEMTDRVMCHLSKRGDRVDDKAVLSLYARIARGSFGRFSETFQLPRDVDVSRISATCDEGVLQVQLPKRIRHPRPMMGRPLFW